MAEFERHKTHHHLAESPEAIPVVHQDPVAEMHKMIDLSEYNLSKSEPILPKPRKADGGADMDDHMDADLMLEEDGVGDVENDAEKDDGIPAAVSDIEPGDGAHDGEAPPRRKRRTGLTSEDWKLMIPLQNTNAAITIRLLEHAGKTSVQAQYDHSKLEPPYLGRLDKKRKYHQKTIGKQYDGDSQQALDVTLEWLWGKHKAISGEERPDWAFQ